MIGERYATLHELETVYSYDDLLTLAEVALVRRYNEWRAHEEGRKKDRLNG